MSISMNAQTPEIGDEVYEILDNTDLDNPRETEGALLRKGIEARLSKAPSGTDETYELNIAEEDGALYTVVVDGESGDFHAEEFESRMEKARYW